MGLLTTKKAARILAEGLGWSVTPYDVEEAVERGRLRAETDPRRPGRCLIPLEEVERLIAEDRQKKARAAEEGRDLAQHDPAACAWDAVPKNGMGYLFGMAWAPWRRHRR
ncbi:MAG: hypothetical protein JW990_03045 [Thermoleophilia bacterium]|nr:hypothetical protein [Thermoleophilia bacterium]